MSAERSDGKTSLDRIDTRMKNDVRVPVEHGPVVVLWPWHDLEFLYPPYFQSDPAACAVPGRLNVAGVFTDITLELVVRDRYGDLRLLEIPNMLTSDPSRAIFESSIL
jgi:hypothetical protein